MSWTAPRTWVTGETLTSTLLNTHLRDNLLTIGGAIGAAYAPAAANTDLAAPTNWMHTIAPTAAGWSVRSIGAAPQAGQLLMLRNTAAFPIALLHATGGGTGAQLNLRGAANAALSQTEAIAFIYDGTAWNEIHRDIGAVLAYAEFAATITATSSAAASAVTVVSAGAVTFDGATKVRVEFFAPEISPSDNTNGISIFLFDGTTATQVGLLFSSSGMTRASTPLGTYAREFTPTAAAHTYFVGVCDGGAITGVHAVVQAAAGGANVLVPGYIKITKAA